MDLKKIPLSLYIHLPWCEKKCPYCDFNVTTNKIDEDEDRLIKAMQEAFEVEKLNFDPKNWEIILNWQSKKQAYKNPTYEFKVRDKALRIQTHSASLSHLQIPKVATPNYKSWGDLLKWLLQENVPGEFPYTSGLFAFKREGEDPTRMFAGEGGPERTNKRVLDHSENVSTPKKNSVIKDTTNKVPVL